MYGNVPIRSAQTWSISTKMTGTTTTGSCVNSADKVFREDLFGEFWPSGSHCLQTLKKY